VQDLWTFCSTHHIIVSDRGTAADDLLPPLQSGTTALHYAAMQDHLEVVVALVNVSWTVEAVDKVKALILRRLGQPQCPGMKYCISSQAPIHSTE
jgi:ankyrin repeat protein